MPTALAITEQRRQDLLAKAEEADEKAEGAVNPVVKKAWHEIADVPRDGAIEI